MEKILTGMDCMSKLSKKKKYKSLTADQAQMMYELKAPFQAKHRHEARYADWYLGDDGWGPKNWEPEIDGDYEYFDFHYSTTKFRVQVE